MTVDPTQLGLVLHQLHQPILLCAGNAAVLFQNEAARRLLEIGDGLQLRDGRLSADCSADSEALLCAIERTARQADMQRAASVEIVERRNAPPLLVRVGPVRLAWYGSASATALVTVNDLGHRHAPSPALLLKLFGLTPAELRLAAAIAEEKRLADIAVEFGVTLGTIKTQLRAVLSKTGTARQSELAALLVRLAHT